MDTKKSDLDLEIDHVLAMMSRMDVGSEDYLIAVKAYRELTEMKRKEKFSVNPDVLVSAATSILGILLIIGYEQAGNIISTKSFSWIKRP